MSCDTGVSQRSIQRKSTAAQRALRLTPLAACILNLGFVQPAAAGPTGGVVREGAATIVQTNAVRVDVNQTSNRAVIDWTTFNIPAGERVQFNQPSASAAVLNRVTGAQMSTIEGQLIANGQVFLVNPNGVLFGAGARVDVGGLVASTADITNARFMANDLRFDIASPNAAARVVNRGRIDIHEGGLAALVAPGVENSGVIVARLGKVALGAGKTFTLDLFGDQLVSFAADAKVVDALVDENGAPVRDLIRQTATGQIFTDGGKTVLISAGAAKGIVDNAINLQGVVVAQSVSAQNGQIVLVGNGGNVEVAGNLFANGAAAGTAGGSIKVTGDSVHVASGTTLDASGDAGGGSVRVGGDGTAALPRAASVSVDGSVFADAVTSGNAGSVTLDSTTATTLGAAGKLSAQTRAGAGAGNGGAATVRSDGTLALAGETSVAAVGGTAGTFNLGAGSFTVGATEAQRISQTMQAGARTNIDTTGALTVNSRIDARGGSSNAATLALNAGGNIALNQDIYTPGGAVSATSTAGSITMSGGIIDLGGGLTRTGTVIDTGSGNITLHGNGNVLAQNFVTTGALALTSDTGSVTLARDHTALRDPATDLLDPRLGSVTISAPDATNGVVNLAVLDARGIDVHAGKQIVANGRLLSVGAPLTLGGAGGSVPQIVLHDSLFTDSRTITLQGDILLAPNDNLNSTNGGALVRENAIFSDYKAGTGADIVFDGTLNTAPGAGNVALLMRAGSAGTIHFNGNVGAPTAGTTLQLAVSDANTVTKAAGVSITANEFWVSGNPVSTLHAGTTFQNADLASLGSTAFSIGPITVTGAASLATPNFSTGPSSIPPGPNSTAQLAAGTNSLPGEILPPGDAPSAAVLPPPADPVPPPAPPVTPASTPPASNTAQADVSTSAAESAAVQTANRQDSAEGSASTQDGEHAAGGDGGAEGNLLVFGGGRGVAQTADLGRTPATRGAAEDVFAEASGDESGDGPKSKQKVATKQ